MPLYRPPLPLGSGRADDAGRNMDSVFLGKTIGGVEMSAQRPSCLSQECVSRLYWGLLRGRDPLGKGLRVTWPPAPPPVPAPLGWFCGTAEGRGVSGGGAEGGFDNGW